MEQGWQTPRQRTVRRAGVIIEVEPGKFVTFVLKWATADIDMTVEDPIDVMSYGGPLTRTTGSRHARIELKGMVSDQYEDTTPPKWAEEPMAEIEGRNALPPADEEIDLGTEGEWL